MKCPFCGYTESKVIDSRPTDGSIRRRRECLSCEKRFTTFEEVDHQPLMVIKKDKTRQPFSKEKLMASFLKACHKRPVSMKVLDKAVNDIEAELQNDMEREVSYAKIGELAMEKLKGIDEIAYVRFASVYRQFKDVSTFMAELQTILDRMEKNSSGDNK